MGLSTATFGVTTIQALSPDRSFLLLPSRLTPQAGIEFRELDSAHELQ